MNKNKKTNETGRSVHRSIKTLEEAVESFIADVGHRIDTMEADKTGQKSWYTLKDVSPALRKLEAAFEAHMGRPPAVPRNPYQRTVKQDIGRDNEIEERHESYGLIHISRSSGRRRLFGSSVQHQHFFTIRILRGRRLMKTFGEHFWDDGRVPIVEVALTPAQFVEMITSQNIGSGVPCTIMDVEGVPMDPTPESAGNEIKLTVEMFEDRLVDVIDRIREHDKNLDTLLDKKTFTKDDKAKIKSVVHEARRLIDDSAPYMMKLIGEHTEKLIAKGKMEIDAFVQLALVKAGIKAIKDSNGTLMLGMGDSDGDGED